MLYVIEGANEHDPITNEILYWHNEYGWVDRDNADVYTEEDVDTLALPMGGKWVPVDEEEFA